ncbi:TolC family protein [Persicimonas caeni]|uniref:TolC family protein n=1 Tax=Persicimonas caeni TaxID=2292766 RepID=A0A4Y6PMG2_PERCE|nr:TolC family protein [Persicimonas caeni]QDG49488.1 TolC family protein [Persicimonas caeni]QED30709.1 TolC family protein [Persicimonas caeni]
MSPFSIQALLRQDAPVKPIAARSFAVTVLAVLVCAAPTATAQESTEAPSLTEEQAIRLALERPALSDSWEAQVADAEAAALTEGAWPNPEVAYTREQVFEDAETVSENVIVLEQTLPLSGRRGLLAEAAKTRARATQLETRAHRRLIEAHVRRAFYRVLELQRRTKVRAEWLERMATFEDQMIQRVEAGENAPFDLQRLRAEIAQVQASNSVDEAALARRRAALAALLGRGPGEVDVQVTGNLAPKRLPNQSTVRQSVERVPEVAAARKQVEAAELRTRAASRWWVPEPTLVGGYKGETLGDAQFHGFVLGIGLALPVFNQLEGEQMAAEAALVRAKSRQELLEQRLLAELAGIAAKTRKLSETAESYREDGVERSEELLDLARQAYDAGEIDIDALMNAYRRAVDSQLRLLELEAGARASKIEWQQIAESITAHPSTSEDE